MHNIISFFTFLIIALPLQANIIWPALFVSDALWASWSIIILSIIIEALLFFKLLHPISIIKSIIMAIFGNIASTIIGTFIMTFGMLLWHLPADFILSGTFDIFNVIATYVLMYLGSCLIELVTIKLIFRYTIKQLIPPVFIGNLATYILAALYKAI